MIISFSRLFALIICIVTPLLVVAQYNTVIKGHLKYAPDSTFVIINLSCSMDTIPVINGKFTYQLTLTEPKLCIIMMKLPESMWKKKYILFPEDYHTYDRLQLFIDPGTISIEGDSLLNNATIKGGQSQTDWEELYKTAGVLIDNKIEHEQTYAQKKLQNREDTTGQYAYFLFSNELAGKIRNYRIEFIKNHPDSYVSLYCFSQLLENRLAFNYKWYYDLFRSLTNSIRNTEQGIYYANMLAEAGKTQPGALYMDFIQPDTSGKPFQLSSLKGKYIFLDFWASWCKPCRAENPNLVKILEKYKDKGLEMVSVSLDSDKQAWINAIETDGLKWYQLSSLKGWDNEASRLYKITAIPQNMLIDPKGIIIGRNLYGDTLNNRLSEILD